MTAGSDPHRVRFRLKKPWADFMTFARPSDPSTLRRRRAPVLSARGALAKWLRLVHDRSARDAVRHRRADRGAEGARRGAAARSL